MRGDAGRKVAGIKPLHEAGPEDLSFLSHPRYRPAAAASHAGGLLVSPAENLPGQNLIVVSDPYVALAQAIGLFYAEEGPQPGISPQAAIGEDVRLGREVAIGPWAVVGRGATLGDRVVLMPGVVVGEEARIGDGTVLHPGVVIYRRSVLGARVTVHAGAVIGSDGFGYAEQEGRRTEIPQVGNVIVEDDVEIGACTAIDRATFGITVIGRGTKIDNLVQVAHNVTIGEDSVLVAQAGIAGSTRLGRRTILAGQSGVGGHLSLGDDVVIGAKSAALQDVASGQFLLGHPAQDHREWKRAQAAIRRLPDLLRRVARLERALSTTTVRRSAAASTTAPAPRRPVAGTGQRGRSARAAATKRAGRG